MAHRIMSNQKNGKTTVLFYANNTGNDLVIVGNNSVSGVAIEDEEVTGAEITAAFYSSNSSTGISINRDANNVLKFYGSGHFERQGMAMNLDASAAVNVTIGTDDILILELDKNSSTPGEY